MSGFRTSFLIQFISKVLSIGAGMKSECKIQREVVH